MDAILSLLPLLFFVACPLMMIFMMRGGHGHGQAQHSEHQAGMQPQSNDDAAARIASLEREVDRLRSEDLHRHEAGQR